MLDFTKITEFNWDEGNVRKNDKHGVSMAEAEQVFFNEPLVRPQGQLNNRVKVPVGFRNEN